MDAEPGGILYLQEFFSDSVNEITFSIKQVIEMKQYEGRHFLFKYESQDCEFAQSVIKIAESMYYKVSWDFDIDPDTELFTLIICPNTETFIIEAEKSTESYQSWMVGNANYEKRKLCILSPFASDRSIDEMLAVVRHEVVHIAFGKVSDKSPDDISPLISEGGAVYLAEQVYPNLLDKSTRPDALKLNDEDYFYDNDGYNYSGVYMGYLIRKYGKEIYKKIYSENEPLEKYLYNGFENDAIDSFVMK